MENDTSHNLTTLLLLPKSHTHTHKYACMHTHTHTHTHTHMHAWPHKHMQAWAHTHTCKHTCAHTHMHIHTHTQAHMQACAHTHTHTHKHAHTHTHTQACTLPSSFQSHTHMHIHPQISNRKEIIMFLELKRWVLRVDLKALIVKINISFIMFSRKQKTSYVSQDLNSSWVEAAATSTGSLFSVQWWWGEKECFPQILCSQFCGRILGNVSQQVEQETRQPLILLPWNSR